MQTITEQIFIAEPPERVFEFVSHYENDRQWRDNLKSLKQTPEGEPRVGTKLKEETSLLGQGIKSQAEVIELEPGKRIVYRSTSAPEPVRGWREVAPAQGGTTFTYGLEVAGGGALKAMEHLLAKAIARDIRGDLQKLKRVLEQQE